MKKLLSATFVLTFVLLNLRLLSAQVQGQWVSTGTLQTTRAYNSQVLVKGKVLAAGGVDNSGNLLASAEIYNPTSGAWKLTGSMASARELFPAVVLTKGKVLVAGGWGSSNTVLASAELFNPSTGTWSSAASLSVARFGHTATVLSNGKVLVTGGCTASGCSSFTAASELYDPVSNHWTTTGSLNTARYYHTAVLLKTGKVLVIGGSDGAATNSCETYDPSTGVWSNVASMNTARSLNGSTLLADGKVLASGGVISKYPMNSAEIYDPTANTWTPTGNMTNGRYGHAALLLPDQTVVAAGGIGQPISCGKDCTTYIPTDSAEIYNEATGTFQAAASLPRALAYQTTSLLAAGQALSAGGIGYTSTCCVVVNNAEIYTPLTLTFSASSLNFGLLQIGLTSGPQTVTLTNVSTHSATFTSIASSGDFAQTNTCPTTLNAGQSCAITVTFKPTAAGTRNGAVTLKDNCPGSPTQTISLTGTGETLALGFTPSALNFGSVVVGSSSTLSANLTNDGSGPVNITGIAISPADGTYTQTNNCPATLGVQQTCTFQIVFMPPDVFTYKATLSVTNSAGSPAQLSFTGTGLNN